MKTIYIKTGISPLFFSLKKAILLGIFLLGISCDSFVDVDLPKSQLTSDAVFADYTTANAAMADIYSKMRDAGMLTGGVNGISVQMGNYADELVFYGSPSNATVSFYTNSVLPSNSNVALLWNNAYNQIYSANAILEGVRNSGFSTQEKAKLEGEALFVRALLHFYLLQLFRDIPYMEITDYKVNSTVKRLAADMVYEKVITDLKTAEGLLSSAYNSTERVRPNSFAAKAFLARVYLYMEEWQDAGKMASSVIDNNFLYLFENNLNKVFLKNSTEAIWQFMPSITGKNTDEASVFYFTSGPPPLLALNQSLVDSFDTSDLRKTSWISAVSNANGKWYYASKYKEPRPTAASMEHSIIFRLTEQYLIRAEARAQSGDLLSAKQDLNKIRNRAGLSDTNADSKEEILEAIILERRKELFTEYGHRFFDLKRTGKLDTFLTVKQGWNTTDRLLPIPEIELSSNPNLKPQNAGY